MTEGKGIYKGPRGADLERPNVTSRWVYTSLLQCCVIIYILYQYGQLYKESTNKFTSDNQYFTIPTFFALNDEGYFQIITKDVRKIYINIGLCDTLDGYDTKLEADPSAVLIAFEPQPNKRMGLEMKLKPGIVNRTMLLPYAISDIEQPQSMEMNIAKTASCSSLKPLNGDNKNVWHGCVELESKIPVTVIPLKMVLQHLPYVSYMKIDAQGVDMEVIMSSGDKITKIKEVEIETQDLPLGDEKMIVQGQPNKDQLKAAMENRGFVLKKCTPNNAVLREENCIFENSRFSLQAL